MNVARPALPRGADAPTQTPSIRIALDDLGLEAVPLSTLAEPGRLFGS